MTEKIKIRAKVQDGITDIRILLQHPMENGRFKDERGNIRPEHFIQTFTITHKGEQLIEGQLNTSVAKNPLFAFKAKGIQPGDTLNVHWKDNLGETRQDESAVT